MLVGIKEELQEKLKEKLTEAGLNVRIWYECKGNEDVVIVPPEMAVDEGFVVELEEAE